MTSTPQEESNQREIGYSTPQQAVFTRRERLITGYWSPIAAPLCDAILEADLFTKT
ncbi:MAG: hypothetical protein ACFB4I_16405 [Cyanophyceae cyanobacterium]